VAVSKHAVGAPIAPWVRRERRKSTNEGGFMSNAHILVIHQGVEYHRTEVLAKDTAPFGTDCGSAVTWHYLIPTHQVVSSDALVRT
jgi:hypothetical protein